MSKNITPEVQKPKGPHMSHDDPELNQRIETTFKELMFEADELDRATADDVSSYLSTTRLFKFMDRWTGAVQPGDDAAAMSQIDAQMRDEMQKQEAQMDQINSGATVVQRSRAGAGMNTAVSSGYGASAARSVATPEGGMTSSHIDTKNPPQNEAEARARMAEMSLNGAAAGAVGAGARSAVAMGTPDMS